MRVTREIENLVAVLRGLPEDENTSRERHGTVSSATLVETLFQRYRIGQRSDMQAILESWPRLVGPSFAQRCAPERITPDGTLLIQVTNPTVRREISFHEPRILTAISSLPECANVHAVAFKAG